MITFDIKSSSTLDTAFTAEINCSETENRSTKLRLAVAWAIENEISLSYADLSGANLSGYNLTAVNLQGTNLRNANLRCTNLRCTKMLYVNLSNANLLYVNLSNANLSNANLSCANLTGVDLSGANLTGAILANAHLHHANLHGVNLHGVNLHNANLYYANLRGANLHHANLLCLGDMKYIKTMQVGIWGIAYTHDTLQIGCQTHTIEKWKDWETESGQTWLSEMHSDALTWARTHLNAVLKLVEYAPAERP